MSEFDENSNVKYILIDDAGDYPLPPNEYAMIRLNDCIEDEKATEEEHYR